MEQTIQGQNPSQVKRSEQEITTLLEKYNANPGMTVKAFCQLNGIREWAFYAWRKRYRPMPSKDLKSGGFLTVEVTNSSVPANEAIGLFAEVGRIRLYQPVSADYLKMLAS
jgi:hypothetical protein